MIKKDKLTKAIEDGNLDLVKKYINKKNINRKKNPPLILACENGHANIAELLIGLGADLVIDANEALRFAAQYGHTETVKLLLDHGANVNANNDQALQSAAQAGQTETVKFLIDSGANAKNDCALRYAAENGHIDATKLLIDSGANVNAENDAALRWTAGYGHAKTVKLLINSGANVNADDGWALRAASYHGHTEIVKILLESGADANSITDKKSQDFTAPIILQIEQEKQEKLRQALSSKNLPKKTEDLILSIKEAISVNFKSRALSGLAKLPEEEIAKLAKDKNYSGFILENWKEISANMSKGDISQSKSI